MPFKKITEGKATVLVPEEKKVSKEMEVFYNPVMKFNRDFSIFVLNAVKNEKMQIASPMAGTGVREIRFFKELNKGKIEKIFINDISEDSVSLIRKNLEGNNIRDGFELFMKDANIFMLEGKGFDYIDIDPFGTPNPFLNSAIVRLARDGILAVTATDTSALAGTYPDVCYRKYWARPMKNELMHEIGLRILIRKIQLIGMNHEKALLPIFSYSKDHYMRVFFVCEKKKESCNSIAKNHKFFLYCSKCMNMLVSDRNLKVCCGKDMEYAGPVWTGILYDEKLVKEINKNIPKDYAENNFFKLISDETGNENLGFIDIHTLSRKYKINPLPKMEDIISLLKKKTKNVSRTHFCSTAIKIDIKASEVAEAINKKEKKKKLPIQLV